MDIEDLYSLLPEVDCPDGCTECCRAFGVPCRTQVEDTRLKAYLHARGRGIGQATGTCCPYVSETGCTVYPARPFTCRLFGGTPSYGCSRGAVPLRPLDADEEAEILHLYDVHFVNPR